MGASQSPAGRGRDSCLHTSKYLCAPRELLLFFNFLVPSVVQNLFSDQCNLSYQMLRANGLPGEIMREIRCDPQQKTEGQARSA